MKIKKKEYKNQLDQRFWSGVEAGIHFALNDPKMAEKYKDNIPKLKADTMLAEPLLQNIADMLSKIFAKSERREA